MCYVAEFLYRGIDALASVYIDGTATRNRPRDRRRRYTGKSRDIVEVGGLARGGHGKVSGTGPVSVSDCSRYCLGSRWPAVGFTSVLDKAAPRMQSCWRCKRLHSP